MNYSQIYFLNPVDPGDDEIRAPVKANPILLHVLLNEDFTFNNKELELPEKSLFYVLRHYTILFVNTS